MYPHRIRLRGPWECQPLAGPLTPAEGLRESLPGPLPGKRRVEVPGTWAEMGLGDFPGPVRFRRRFGYPGRIDDYERVWLTLAAVRESALVWLNDQFLGRFACPLEAEVTSLLRNRNRLDVVVQAPAEGGGLLGEVALEVRCTAFLRNLRLHSEPDSNLLHVRGEVVGSCARPLELYVLLGRSTAGYTTIEAAPSGQPFDLAVVVPAGLSPLVRVELVNVSQVWYVFEQPLFQQPENCP